jgi:hypothetical protein
MNNLNCLLCERDGISVSGERYVPGYNFNVCRMHWEGNLEGWGPHYQEIILERLRQNNIREPPRNSNGMLPREYPKP